jgi:carbohydrate-selective porin OprB
MDTTARAFAIAATLAQVLLVSERINYAQQSTPSPSPSPATPAAEKSTNNAQNAANDATNPAAPEPDFWRQQTMTGDWGGTRSRWKEKGIELEFKSSNFYQGVASGGIRQDEVYNGKFRNGVEV